MDNIENLDALDEEDIDQFLLFDSNIIHINLD